MPLNFGGYPATYQQYYPQIQPYQGAFPQNNIQAQPQQVQDQKAINGFDWVLGSEGAASYLVPAGKTFILFDASPNSDHFYIKTADMTGKPYPAVMFDYCEHKDEPVKKDEKPVVDLSDCVKKGDLEALRKEIEELRQKSEAISADDVREIFDQMIGDRFSQLTAPTHEAKTRKKETA